MRRLSVKAETGNSGTKWGKWEKQNRNVANQCGYIRNLDGNVENGQNQCGNAGDHGGSFVFLI